MLRVVLALCVAEVLTMVGVFAFPALLPEFMERWALSATEAGWIAGVTFAGYAVAVPVLSALTDRVDARGVWLAGAGVTAVSAAGFALVADGFWSAMAFRALGGVGMAGTYMPGLKALVDRTQGPRQPRWMSWYTASYSLGTSLSFLFAGLIGPWLGWRAAFGLSAAAAVGGAVLVAVLVPPKPVPPAAPAPLLNFAPVLRDRAVMGYVLGYAAHMWELFALRSWMVAFMAFALSLQPGAWGPAPTTVATLGAFVAMIGSIGGADLAVRFDRRRVCMLAAVSSAVLALGLGFLAPIPYALLAVVMLVYNAVVQLDSAALTTGAVLETDPTRRGATIAVHSLLGFAAAFAGPLAFGAVIDAAGGGTLAGGLAFASVAAVGLFGPLALRWSRPSCEPTSSAPD